MRHGNKDQAADRSKEQVDEYVSEVFKILTKALIFAFDVRRYYD